MTRLTRRAAAAGAVLALAGCAAQGSPPPGDPAPGTLEPAVADAMAEGRRAIAEHGETAAAMERVRAALGRLAGQPALRGRAPGGRLHGSATMQAEVLASDGDDALTLAYVRFSAGSATPVHDHLTWGVVHVVEGEDRYIEWERADDGSDPDSATIRPKRDVVLRAGDSAYWLPPPRDLHSQAPVGGDATELVMAGKNLLGPSVLGHRHNYDPETGRVTRPGGR